MLSSSHELIYRVVQFTQANLPCCPVHTTLSSLKWQNLIEATVLFTRAGLRLGPIVLHNPLNTFMHCRAVVMYLYALTGNGNALPGSGSVLTFNGNIDTSHFTPHHPPEFCSSTYLGSPMSLPTSLLSLLQYLPWVTHVTAHRLLIADLHPLHT